jgi:heterodisulfide reductase subunit A-like polyferredoxin
MSSDKNAKTLEDLAEVALQEAEEASKHPYTFKKVIKSAAVIGAGPAGVN